MSRSGFILTLLFSLIVPEVEPAGAVEAPKNYLMQSCEATPALACIERITATTKAGLTAVADRPISSQVMGSGEDLGTYEEWVLPGFNFEGSSKNKVIPRIVFRPYGAKTCNFEACFVGLEEIQVGIEPTWLVATDEDLKSRAMDLSRRGSQKLCGDLKNPQLCYRAFNFNLDFSIKIEMRIPKDFTSSAILGSVKDLVYTETSSSLPGFKSLAVIFSPQKLQRPLFSALVPSPMKSSQYADFEADQSNFWIVGKRSNQSAKLGRCSTVPFITVLSNSIYQELPVWNVQNQTIEVGLTAPHFTVNGDLHRGYFEATISKAMGECLWGIDLSKKAIAKMSISYQSEGIAEVQTVSGSFDGENYKLFSSNFHYSSPTVAFKLVSEVAAPTPTNSPSPIAKKITVITCVKGKTTKKVAAEKPKCPTGFKLKV